MALKKCAGCGIPLGSDVTSCPKCGTAQSEAHECARCGVALEAGMRFCPECGQAVSAGTAQQSAQRQAPGVPPTMASAQPPTANAPRPQNAPQNFAPPSPQTFAPPQGAGAQPFPASPVQTSPDEAVPAGGQPMSRPTGAPGSGFGSGARAAGAAGGLGEWKEKLLSFEGRLNRKPYVLRGLAVCLISSVIVQIVSGVLGLIVAKVAESSPDLGMALLLFLYAVIFVLYLPATVIGISLGIRRCHDNNWSGWLVLLHFVPLANIVFGLLLLFKPGTPGPNRFGPDPLQ